MNKKTVINLLLGTIFAFSNAWAEDKINTNNNVDSSNQIQKVIDEYKNYVNTISPALRDEIVDFRKKVSALNKQKRDLYNSLSQEAQSYLAKTQEYKKRLPIKQRSLINLENPGQKPAPLNNDDNKNLSPSK